MGKSIYSGNYTKAFLSTKVSSADSIEQSYYNDSIEVSEGEGCYIYSFKENKLMFSKGIDKCLELISENLSTSTESIQKSIDELYRRFNVKSEVELVEFAKTNFLIPNQFEIYNF